jgi:TRAP-type C4-dicarboxylate transport system permease small subunit
MSGFLRFADALDIVTRALAAFACAAICVVMAAQVFYRYVLNDSLLWSEEVSVWVMVWMVFLAAPVLTLHNEHVTVTAALQPLPARLQPYFIILAKLLTLIFLVFLAWYGWKVFNQSFHRVSPTMRISSKWSKLALAFGGVLMTVMCLASLARDMIALRRGDKDHFDRQIAPPEPVGDV